MVAAIARHLTKNERMPKRRKGAVEEKKNIEV